ncbi:hypothetical protein BH11PSE12_BH11PSE12_04610 [soil metagenome]
MCAKDAGVPIKIMDGETLFATEVTERKALDHFERPVFCKDFNGKEALDDRLKIIVPDKAEIMFL